MGVSSWRISTICVQAPVDAPGLLAYPGNTPSPVCEPHPVDLETRAVCSTVVPAPLLPLAQGQTEPDPVPENESDDIDEKFTVEVDFIDEFAATQLVAQNFEDEKVGGEILDDILTTEKQEVDNGYGGFGDTDIHVLPDQFNHLESLDEETFQRTGGSAQVLSKSSMEYIMKKMLDTM